MAESKIEIDKYIDATCVDKELLLKFFVVFSRFEYALKRAKYCKNSEAAMPDWEKFALACRALNPEDTLRLKEVGRYLLDSPPEKQIYSANLLSFAPIYFTDGTHVAEKLIRYVKTVRNNLFHGGKYPEKPVAEISRNPKLLNSSIDTLVFFLETNEKLRELFVDVG